MPVPGSSGAPTFVVPHSIDATGRTDVTLPLHTFMAGVPNGSTILFPAGARYRIEQTIQMHDRHDLTFEGNGATLFATTTGDRTRSQLSFLRGSDIVIRNLVIHGANPYGGTSERAYVAKLEAQHAFEFLGTQHVVLDHVTATDTYGDFVYFGMDLKSSVWSNDVTVENSTFARNGRQGISLTAARNVVIEHNTINDTRRAVVDLEPNTPRWGADHVTIANNIVGPGRLFFIASHGNGPVNNVLIAGNVLHGHILNIEVRAPDGTRRANWTITGNSSDKVARGRVIRLLGVDNVTVRNNKQRVSPHPTTGIELAGGCNYTVTGNDLQYGTVSMQPTACK